MRLLFFVDCFLYSRKVYRLKKKLFLAPLHQLFGFAQFFFTIVNVPCVDSLTLTVFYEN